MGPVPITSDVKLNSIHCQIELNLKKISSRNDPISKNLTDLKISDCKWIQWVRSQMDLRSIWTNSM